MQHYIYTGVIDIECESSDVAELFELAMLYELGALAEDLAGKKIDDRRLTLAVAASFVRLWRQVQTLPLCRPRGLGAGSPPSGLDGDREDRDVCWNINCGDRLLAQRLSMGPIPEFRRIRPISLSASHAIPWNDRGNSMEKC